MFFFCLRSKEVFLKCRQINWKIPVMDFISQQCWGLRPVTLPKMCFFRRIFNRFCTGLVLSLKISQKISVYQKHLHLFSNYSNQFSKNYLPKFACSRPATESWESSRYLTFQLGILLFWCDKTWSNCNILLFLT